LNMAIHPTEGRKAYREEMIASLEQKLTERRSPGALWRGELSPSAVSTATAVFALSLTDKTRYAAHISAGVRWLRATMLPGGGWGDTPESKANLTATLLACAALFHLDAVPEATTACLNDRLGGADDERVVKGILAYYGKDLTFSVPILAMCALAGMITRWDVIPRLPFEAGVLPQRLFRFLRLPVVSYAIPALIASGILRHRRGGTSVCYTLREAFVGKTLKVLAGLQPANGGFLEAAPLTAFVAMCMAGAGYGDHVVTRKAAGFLADTVRADGAWPIDTDLAGWVTTLGVKALEGNVPDGERLAEIIAGNAFPHRHPFTGAQPGGWGWTDLPGAAPDADDTAGCLIALHLLREKDSPLPDAVVRGIKWLLGLQNSDGGMPTFCRGWSKLPFDRSSPDISAHSLAAISCWLDALPDRLQRTCRRRILRLLRWMARAQAADGSWTPLWFGDQDAPDGQSPVYGTAVAVEYLFRAPHPQAVRMAERGCRFLLEAQNDDGGWGGAKGVPSKVTFTARALSALAAAPGSDDDAIDRGTDFLYGHFKAGTISRAEPVGLYFARLWYSEEMYNLTFTLSALKRVLKLCPCPNEHICV
jgi:squalene-hopene/tetraprenyl-beta-curcumene cyclase